MISKNTLYLIIFCFFTFTQFACGQTGNNLENTKIETEITKGDVRAENLQKLINTVKESISNNDVGKIKNLIFFPKEIEKTNPEQAKRFREKGLAQTQQEIDQAKAEGFKFEIHFGDSKEIIESENTLFSFIPTKSVIRIEKSSQAKDFNGNNIQSGRYEMDGFELAVSENNGQDWYLWRGTPEFFKMVFPEASKKITFPKRQTEPVFYPE